MEIYNGIGQIQTLDEIQKVIEAFGKNGYVAVDSQNQINMTQIEMVLDFCEKVEAKEYGQIIIYVISYYDGYTEENFGEIDFYDMFDLLYPMVYGERVPYDAASNYEDGIIYMIPKAEFELVIMTYFKIDDKTLQDSTRYYQELKCYEYRPRGLYDWELPEIPYPEVVNYKENADGTLSLVVNVVYPDMNISKMFAHEVVVRPLEDGKVQYVSNHIIYSEDNYEEIWHEERLTDEMWREIYGDEITFIEKMESGEEIE